MQKAHPVTLTCIIATYNRKRYLPELLSSLSKAILKSADLIKFEVVFVVNGADPDSKQLIEKDFQACKTKIIQLQERVSPAQARNHGAESCNSDWISFLDDDISLPEDYFINFIELCTSGENCDILGGPNVNPTNSNPSEKKVGQLMANPFITGPMFARYTKNNSSFLPPRFKMTLCNLFVKNNLFLKIKFQSSFVTAEENDFMLQAEALGAAFKFSEKIYVQHYRRSSFEHFTAQIKNYGVGRGQIIKRHKQKYFLHLFFIFLMFLLLLINTKVSFYLLSAFYFTAVFSVLFTKSFWSVPQIFYIPIVVWSNYVFGIFKGLFLK